ncbi:MAG TPA: potassium/proton antiporter [Microlunatus sp.]|nr:potassium/proton antiporter [Microlunatus sp.]
MINLDLILLVGSVVVIVAILSARLGTRVGLPALLLFLGVGMLLGQTRVNFDNPDLAHALGFGALVIILAEGGLTTKWSDIRPGIGVAGLLATVGIGISVALMAVFGHVVLGLDWWIAILLGAIVSPTDAAAVFSVLRNVPLPHRLRGVVEAESGLNDAPTVLLVALASSAALTGSSGYGPVLLTGIILLELVAGIGLGVLLGWLGAQMLRRVALPASGLYPLATLVWIVFVFGVTSEVHASGFAAVYACALMLGNAQLPHRGATRSFVEGIGWIAQIGLFVMLGLLAVPERLVPREVGIALAAGLFLTFVARPVSVLLCATPFRMPFKEQVFLSWAGLRGAVPIIMATVPLSMGVPDAAYLFDVVLIFVVIFTCLQAPTLPFVARKLGLIDLERAREVEVEVAPLDMISAELLQVRVPEGSRIAGIEVGELRLPLDTVVTLIIRDQTPFRPGPQERLKVADELLIVTPSSQRERAERRLALLSRQGRLASWRKTANDPETPRRPRRSVRDED